MSPLAKDLFLIACPQADIQRELEAANEGVAHGLTPEDLDTYASRPCFLRGADPRLIAEEVARLLPQPFRGRPHE